MLRAIILALIVANLTFYAWSQGWLDSVVGTRSIGDREPERLARQVQPEALRILAAGAALDAPPAASSASATPVLACLEAGPFTDAELTPAQTAAQAALPVGTPLVDIKVPKPGTWMVYMGRFATPDALAKKEDELKRRKTPYEEVRQPAALAPGLSLGRFDDRAAATKALDDFSAQGVRTARVIEFAPASTGHVLRVEKADAALATQVVALRLPALGKGFAPCARP